MALDSIVIDTLMRTDVIESDSRKEGVGVTGLETQSELTVSAMSDALGAGFGELIKSMRNAEKQYVQIAASLQSAAYGQSRMDAVTAALSSTSDASDVKRAEAGISQIVKSAEKAAAAMKTALTTFLVNPFSDAISKMLQTFSSSLRLMAAEIAANKVFEAIGKFGAENSGSWWGNILAAFGGGSSEKKDEKCADPCAKAPAPGAGAGAGAGAPAEKKEEEKLSQLETSAKKAAESMREGFEKFLFSPFNDGLSNMLKKFSDSLRLMAAEIAASKVFEMLGKFGQDNSGKWWGQILSVFGETGKNGGKATPAAGGAASALVSSLLAPNNYGVGAAAFSGYGGGFSESLTSSRSAVGGSVGGASFLDSSRGGVHVEIINSGAPARVESASMQQQSDGTQLLRLAISAVADDLASGGRTMSAIKGRLDVRERI